jgi:hypothetical protein
MAHETDASIGELVRSALEDVRELFREEVALARAEMRHELSKASGAAIRFGIAGAALMLALGCFVVALALGIAALFEWPAWSGSRSWRPPRERRRGVMLRRTGRRNDGSADARTVHTLKENFR